jgi:hypothetical protein
MVQLVQSTFTWWIKYYIEVEVTEEGIFAKDMVPDDYGGATLSMEVVMRVIGATKSGYFSTADYTDISNILDSTRKLGVGLTFQEFPDIPTLELFETPPVGPSDESIMARWRENAYFAQERKKILAVYNAVMANAAL